MASINFLFWNVNRKDLDKELIDLVEENQIDVLILAEYTGNSASLLENLNRDAPAYFFMPSFCERIKIFSKFGNDLFVPIVEDAYWSICRINLPSFDDFIFVAAHFSSKLHYGDEMIYDQAMNLVKNIAIVEKKFGHKRTIVVGDFNMNPFEMGMVGAGRFNATMDRQIALKETRVLQKTRYDYFYNPMWSFLGDLSRGNSSGSYYYSKSDVISYCWNMFDQVLVRPALIPAFEDQDLDIITNTRNLQLLSNKGMPSKKYSDHLPIKFSIRLNIV